MAGRRSGPSTPWFYIADRMLNRLPLRASYTDYRLVYSRQSTVESVQRIGAGHTQAGERKELAPTFLWINFPNLMKKCTNDACDMLRFLFS